MMTQASSGLRTHFPKTILLSLVMTLLAACGGGGGGGGQSTQPPLVAPTGLSYPSSQTLTIGTPMPAIAPSVTGTVTSYSVAPALPAGLALNSSTGQISGTPTAALAATRYTVTASNSAGSATFDISIGVVAPAAPSALS